MGYAGERLIYDADSHLMELPDFLSAHADPSSRHLLPPLGTRTTGLFDPGEHVGKTGQSPETVRKLLELGDRITRGPKWHDALAHSAARGAIAGAGSALASKVRSSSRHFVPG